MSDWTELQRTTSSVVTGFARFLAMFLVVCAAGYLWQGVEQHFWWPAEYVASLLIPLLVIPTFIWFAFVPQRLRFNTEYIELTSRFSGVQLLLLSKLRRWGKRESVLLLQFEEETLHRRTLQIDLQFYSAESRNGFLQFLAGSLPEGKTSLWWGIRGPTIGSR